MATVLIVGELGSGSDHAEVLSPLAAAMAKRGHQVVVALGDLRFAEALFPDVAVCQAPFGRCTKSEDLIEPVCTFADILQNAGFSAPEELHARVEAWRTLFELIGPDAVICDHSPTALLALRGTPIRRAVVGVGFHCPVDESPLPNLRPWHPVEQSQQYARERHILASINHSLTSSNLTQIQRITQLYSEADTTVLTTFAELDPFPHRRDQPYWGPVMQSSGEAPDWPTGQGDRVFASLRPGPMLDALFAELTRRNLPTLWHADEMDELALEPPTHPDLATGNSNLDLVARSCQYAIINGRHAQTAAMLLAGKPIMFAPLALPEILLAWRASRLNAACHIPAEVPEALPAILEHFLSSATLIGHARVFQGKYASFSARVALDGVIGYLENSLELA